MSAVRTLRRGEAVALSALPGSRRNPGELVVSVHGDGLAPDVVALLLGATGTVGSDRDLVFFNQSTSPDGAVAVDPAVGRTHIRTRGLEDHVARVLVACAGDALEQDRATTLRVDVSHSGGGVLATAVVEVPAHHRAETLLEVYRWGAGWRLRLLGEGYAAGIEGLVRDHGVQVDDDAVPAAAVAPSPPVTAPSPPVAAPSPPVTAWSPPTPTPAAAAVAPSPPSGPPVPTPRRASRRRRRAWGFVGAGAAALTALVVIGAATGGGEPTPTPVVVAAVAVTSSATPTPSVTALAAASTATVPETSTAQAALAALPVKGRAPMTGYDRSAFGQTWADVDRNGCDTRNDVLRRDVTGAVVDPSTHGCVVVSGTVADPYSGRTIAFVRGGTSSAVQIDHVVALGDAWQTGAQALDATRREQFANDPANLVAVDGALNAQKGDGDAATWLPPATGYRCTYVARQIAVKQAYGLWVTAAERDAMAGILATCPGATAVPATTSVAPPPTTAAPPPTAAPPTAAAPTTPAVEPPPAVDPGSVSYANCDAVRAAGKAPLLAGQPGYSRKLDRDGDGIACET